MPGPDGQVHRGWRRQTRWALESSWGELPAEPEWLSVPIQDGAMGLATTVLPYEAPGLYGGLKRTVLLREGLAAAGRVVTLAWPQVTEYLLDAALARVADPESADYQDLSSYSVDFYTPSDPRRFSGAVVEELELRAEPRAAAFALTLRAWKEESNAGLSANDFDYAALSPAPFRLRGAQVSINTVAVADVEAFTLTVRSDVREGPSAGGLPAFLIAGRRTVRLDLAKLDASSVFGDALRDGTTLSFAASFSHPEGHTLTLSAPALHAAQSEELAPPERVARVRPRLVAATDGAGCDVSYEVFLS